MAEFNFYAIADEVEAIFCSLSQNRSWFIMGSFTKLRPETRKIADNHYSVWGHFDGSLLRLITPPLNRVENGVRELVSGSLSHPRTNWNEDQRQMERVPDEVRIAYADIVKTIKLHLIRKKFGKNVWIGEKAAKLIADGKAQILVHVLPTKHSQIGQVMFGGQIRRFCYDYCATISASSSGN
jgi:hypothetical protein